MIDGDEARDHVDPEQRGQATAEQYHHAGSLGTGVRSSALCSTIAGVTLSISASGLILMRCSTASGARCLMSSGITKSRSSSMARTLAHLNRAIAARVLGPVSTSGSLRTPSTRETA